MPEFYTENEVIKSDFLFISYKHENKDVVSKTVDWLISSGVRLWYDKDLKPGDEWDKRVENLIKHDNCKGAIFFNSCLSYLSDAVSKERKLVLDKKKEYEKENKSFLVLPVNIDKPSTLQLIKEVFSQLPDSESEISKDFPEENIKVILELFKGNIIRCTVDNDNPDDFLHQIYNAISGSIPGVIDKTKLKLEQIGDAFSTKKSHGLSCVEFGVWKDKIVNAATFPNFILSKCREGKFEYNDSSYIASSDKIYSVKPISWICLYSEDETVTMISEKFVDVGRGGAELCNWLENFFTHNAFTAEEQSALKEKVSLLTREDIEKIDKQALICNDSEYNEKNWWINAYNGNLQKVIRENGDIYENGYRTNTNRAIRPVVKICIESLISILEGD